MKADQPMAVNTQKNGQSTEKKQIERTRNEKKNVPSNLCGRNGSWAY